MHFLYTLEGTWDNFVSPKPSQWTEAELQHLPTQREKRYLMTVGQLVQTFRDGHTDMRRQHSDFANTLFFPSEEGK